MNRRQKLVQQQFLNNERTVIARLQYTYDGALSDINKKIRELEFHIGDLTEEYDWMEDDDPKKEVIRSMIQSKIYQKQYQEQLQKQVEGILKQMQTKQFLTISDYLDTCYEDGFIGSIFDLHGQGVPLMIPLDQTKMVRAIQLESKIKKGLYTRLGEDVDVLKKRITAEVSRSIATGASYAQCAQRLAGQTKIGYNKAVRIARTEGHRIQTTAAMDVMESAKEKGADVLKQWDAALDDRTRESHVAVDGEIREVDKPFSNGLMYPGDPAGGAAEVINCRCALLQRARWALDEDELQTLKDRAEYFGLDKSEQFDDFKKKYLKAVEEPKARYAPDYDCEVAKKFGKDHYDAMHQLVVDNVNTPAVDVWKKYEADVSVGDAHHRGGAYAISDQVYLDIDKVAKGDRIGAPYQTAFHEIGHAIDSLARYNVKGGSWYARHYSSAYKDGLFPQTIKDEVQELINAKAVILKQEFKDHAGDIDWFREHGYVYRWETKIPKYSKSFAYKALENEIKNSGSMLAWGDLSDMLEGATGAKIQCGVGHGATYWKDRTREGVADGLATEAFAEMMDSTFANPESLAMIQKYLPKSYGVFLEMLEDLL